MWVRVDEEEMRSRVMKALSNPDLRKMLVLLNDEPKSVSSLANVMNIPLSTAYNHVHELVEAGLTAVERVIITDEGKRHEVYRSVAKEVRTYIESGNLVVEILPDEDEASRFYRLWSSLKKVK